MIANDRNEFAAIMLKKRAALIEKVEGLKSKGYSNAQIAKELGMFESTVRELLTPQ